MKIQVRAPIPLSRSRGSRAVPIISFPNIMPRSGLSNCRRQQRDSWHVIVYADGTDPAAPCVSVERHRLALVSCLPPRTIPARLRGSHRAGAGEQVGRASNPSAIVLAGRRQRMPSSRLEGGFGSAGRRTTRSSVRYWSPDHGQLGAASLLLPIEMLTLYTYSGPVDRARSPRNSQCVEGGERG